MNINWKRVVIAGIWAELLLLAIYIPAKEYAGAAFIVIAVLAMFGSMFLGGLWVARMIESRFVLHGVLVGIVAGVVFYALFFSFRSIVWPNEPPSPIANDVFAAALKILGAAVGAYVGGIRRKKLLSAQTAKLPS